jgi:hypothetical protein
LISDPKHLQQCTPLSERRHPERGNQVARLRRRFLLESLRYKWTSHLSPEPRLVRVCTQTVPVVTGCRQVQVRLCVHPRHEASRRGTLRFRRFVDASPAAHGRRLVVSARRTGRPLWRFRRIVSQSTWHRSVYVDESRRRRLNTPGKRH